MKQLRLPNESRMCLFRDVYSVRPSAGRGQRGGMQGDDQASASILIFPVKRGSWRQGYFDDWELSEV